MQLKHTVVSYLPTILQLHQRGWTMERIGQRYGCTRERIRQVLYLAGDTPQQLTPPGKLCQAPVVGGCSRSGRYRIKYRVCLCDTHHLRLARGDSAGMFKPTQTPKVVVCGRCRRNIPPDAKRCRGLCGSCYSNWAYHNVPERKESVKAWTYRWMAHIKANDPVKWARHREKQRLAEARYYAKLKAQREVASA